MSSGNQSQPVFNWELCADLHNKLLDIGWEAIGEIGRDQDMDSWWKHYFGQEAVSEDDPEREDKDPLLAEELERRLHPDLINFLKKARHDYPGAGSRNLFYYIQGLLPPRRMIGVLNEDYTTAMSLYLNQPDRYAGIYFSPDCDGSGVGFDQKEMKVAFLKRSEYLQEYSTPWVPMEYILQSCLEMIEQKRIVAVSLSYDFSKLRGPMSYDDWKPEWEIEINIPWTLSQEDDKIVDDTILAWHGLLSAIESRIPGTVEGERKRYRYSNDQIDLCDLQGYFIKKFLQKAQIPTFRFVAPGIQVTLPEELSDQPFKDFVPPLTYEQKKTWERQVGAPMIFELHFPLVEDPTHRMPPNMVLIQYKWYPFLFLRTDQPLPKAEGKCDGYTWERTMEFSTGLYITSTKTIERCDGCKLLLPFSIASNGFSKLGDGTPIHKFRQHEGLYQPGRKLISWEDELLRLEQLFKNWTCMVENGYWEVDENGVVGGIEKFKEADTQDKSELYWISRAW